jgi:TPR repeat protein
LTVIKNSLSGKGDGAIGLWRERVMKKPMFILMLLVSVNVGAGDYEEGWKAYLQDDWVTAFAMFKNAADKGHAPAQYMVGSMYLHGKGVSSDDGQAVNWYLKAAEQGHSDAQISLAMLYYNGSGVPVDYEWAVYWTVRAAEGGNVNAQGELVWMYRNCRDIYTRRFFRHCKEIEYDIVQEYKWTLIRIAQQQGVSPADISVDGYEEEMTAQQIAEAKRLANEWKPSDDRQ